VHWSASWSSGRMSGTCCPEMGLSFSAAFFFLTLQP
jgi:hypothetical protein